MQRGMGGRSRGAPAGDPSALEVNNSAADDIKDTYPPAALLRHLSTAEAEQLKKDVIDAINNETVGRGDLGTIIPRLLEGCRHEAREARRGLRSSTALLVASGRRALHALESNQGRVEQLTENFQKIGKAIGDMRGAAASYSHLRRLHFFHRNVTSIIDWTQALSDVHNMSYGQLLMNENKIAETYKHVRQMEVMRAIVYGGRAGRIPDSRFAAQRRAFEPYFTKQKANNMLFIQRVHELFGSVVVAGIEEAQRLDGEHPTELVEAFEAIKQCVAVCEEEKMKPTVRPMEAQQEDREEPALLDPDEYDAVSPLGNDAIRAACRTSVDAFWVDEVLKDNPDISTNIPAMELVGSALATLETILLPLSARFDLWALVVQAFHSKVMAVFDDFINPANEMESHVLLQAMTFAGWYKNMLAECGFTRCIEAPEAIDVASGNMLAAAVGGLKEHMPSRARGCAIQISKEIKETKPLAKPSGTLYTSGPVDLFVILQQSLSPISSAQIEPGILRQLGVACCGAIATYLNECRRAASFEEWEDENDELPKPLEEAEWTEKRLMQLAAFVNDHMAMESNMETVTKRFVGVWSASGDAPESGDPGDASSDSSGDSAGDKPERDSAAKKKGRKKKEGSPFIAIAEKISKKYPRFYLVEIAKHVVRVTAPEWKKLFVSPDWLNVATNPLSAIHDTAGEYYEEMTALLEPMYGTLLLRVLAEQLTVTYINYLLFYCKDSKAEGSKFDQDNFIKSLDRDIYTFGDAWGPKFSDPNKAAAGGASTIESAQRCIRAVYEFFTATTATLTTRLQQTVLEDCPDCPTLVLQLVVDRRSDLDRKGREAMLRIWKEAIADQQRVDDIIPPSVRRDAQLPPPSLLTRIDMSLGEKEKRGFFGGRKKRDKAKEEQAAKQKRRAERAEKKAEAAAKVAAKAAKRRPSTRGKAAEAEVEDLATVLSNL